MELVGGNQIQSTHGKSRDLTQRGTLPSECDGERTLRGNGGKQREPILMTLTYTVQVKLRLSMECDSDRRRVEVGGGWKVWGSSWGGVVTGKQTELGRMMAKSSEGPNDVGIILITHNDYRNPHFLSASMQVISFP